MKTEVKTIVRTRRHHFGVTCGEHGTVIYEVPGTDYGNGTLYGLSFSALGLPAGNGDRYEVSIRRLNRHRPRFPRNPWLHRRRNAHRG